MENDKLHQLIELKETYIEFIDKSEKIKEMLDLIDNFLKDRKKVIDFIKNYEFESDGSHVLEMDQFPGFFCSAQIDVDIDIDKGDYWTSPVADTKIRIIDLSFTIVEE